MNRLIFLIILIWSATNAYSGDLVDCVYRAKQADGGRHSELQEYRNCATRVEGKMSLKDEHLKQLAFDIHGIASAFIHGKHYYIKPNGTMLPVITFDNWADDYSEGLTRSAVDGKIAYYDRAFEQIIAPTYDWGGPFKNGRALVCKGCKVQPPDHDGHQSVTGGLWGYIDKKGVEIIPVKFTPGEAAQM